MLAVAPSWRHAVRSCALAAMVGVSLTGCSGGGGAGRRPATPPSQVPSSAALGPAQPLARARLPRGAAAGLRRIAARARAGSQVTAAVGGGFSGYALLTDGSVWAWGDDLEGQIGSAGAWYQSARPVAVPGLSQVVAIVGGENDAYALDRDGDVWAWGDNGSDELGDEDVTFSQRPARIAVPSGVVALAAGMFDGYALRRDGTVWAWGSDGEGQLGGAGAQVTSGTPRRVQRLAGVVAIAAGASDGYALRRDGSVWAWGAGAEGQLGRGCDGSLPAIGARDSPCLIAAAPVRVRGLRGAVAIAAGAFTTYALLRDGTVWAWGDNSFGELGTGAHGVVGGVPVRVRGLSHVVAIAAGAYTAYALLRNGTLWAWGRGAHGELGDGTDRSSAAPVRVLGLSHVVKMQAGDLAAYALDASGRLWAWGNDDYGQLGDGHLLSLSAPTRVMPFRVGEQPARRRPPAGVVVH